MLEAYENVSDLNMTADKPFQVESFGELKEVPMRPPIKSLTPFQTEMIALNLVGRNRRLTKNLLTDGSCDLSYQLAGKARFRVNVFSQKGCLSTVMRQLPTRVPTIDELHLPEAFHKMGHERNGIIMITGATGTGKTTSLAAILNEINEKYPVHVVTLEDPVEYVHSQKVATFNQREMGIDFSTFAMGLRAALRQAPKVILVGEMRDRESVEIAMAASETGHLVLSTIHTVDAGQTINRIVGMFDTEEEHHVRNRLAGALRWVACQRLLPKTGGGRIAAFEIMQSNLRVQECVRVGEAEGRTFYEIVEAGRPFGMMTFDQCIAEFYQEGMITEETAMSYCSKRSVMGRSLDAIKAARGEKTTNIEELRIDTEYGKNRVK
jgi:twitching motility protein PilT